jgi:hypothetical protein
MAKVKKLFIAAALLVVANAFALDFSSFFSKNYKPEWISLSEDFEIDKKSVVKEHELGSASIKTFSRKRAKEVGVKDYEHTAFTLEFDCRQNQFRTTVIADYYKSGHFRLLNFSDADIWKPISSTSKGNVSKAASLTFEYVCKR